LNLIEKKIGKNRFSGYQKKKHFHTSDTILKSWNEGVHEVISKDMDSKGLRAPQFGALCAIRSHWTVSNKTATIVMPTGTGKSETMLATIVSEKISKSLIIVPSDTLRSQFYDKSRSFGILYDIGMLNVNVLPPNVFLYAQGIKDSNLFEDLVLKSNVIITTMSLANRLSAEYLEVLSENIDALFVDEAHHISSKTWSRFRENFFKKRILQFTATPFREDGKKVDGDIIYNFPLRLAQNQQYFQKIDFASIEEYDNQKSDLSIAKKSIEILDKDIRLGYNHILLVRANNVKRAKELYEKIYKRFYKKYNPVLVTSHQKASENKASMEALKILKSKIVVCVDMFAEGIDIPNLKIAAIHDKYKSLPITLQFIGRFARGSKGLGSAKLIANVADEDISDALKDLYEKDADWSNLLQQKSNEYIDKEVSLQDFIKGFNTDSVEDINLAHLVPKVSMLAFRTQDKKWHWKNWMDEFDSDKCKSFINREEKTLVIIEPREVGVRWTSQQNLNNLEWNFYIIYWNKEKQIVFLNASDLSKGKKIVRNLFDSDPILINSEQVFKCLHGIKRLSLGTVGLNSGIDGPIRYKMFAGIDVAEGISESNKINSYKSNFFGNGFNGNGKVSIGCSYKGTIWAHWVESIDYWKKWCNQIIDKILDPSINVQDIMDGVLIPTIIKKVPKIHAYRIDWPHDLEFETQRKILLSNISGEYSISEVDILLDEDQPPSDKIYFFVQNEYFSERFSFEIKEDKYMFHSVGGVTTEIKIGNKPIVELSEFFQENCPTIWFVDGSSIQGNILVKLNKENMTNFPTSSINVWDWKKLGVDIKIESQLEKKTYLKKGNSIQYNLIKELKRIGDYNIIFDDDGAGEIADVVAISEQKASIHIDLFHCKYAHGEKPGKRVKDLYEVCGQADKSVFWKQNIVGMIDRMMYRERKRISENNTSRFEKGEAESLKVIKNKLLMQPSSMQIVIVQPGVRGIEMTDSMHSILSTSHSYCMDTFSVPLKLICS